MDRNAMRTLAVIVLVLLAAGCSRDEDPDPTPNGSTSMDMGANQDMRVADVGASNDAGKPDVAVPAIRTMADGFGNQLPARNRVVLPDFRPLFSGNLNTSRIITPAVREAFAETPYRAPVIHLGPGSVASTYGVAGEGVHTASVWLGMDDGDPREDIVTRLQGSHANLVGVTLADATTEPVAVDLAPVPDSLIAENGRLWMRFEAAFEARTGPFAFQVTSTGLRLHAPIVLLGTSTTMELVKTGRRPTKNELRSYQQALKSPRRYRELPPGVQR